MHLFEEDKIIISSAEAKKGKKWEMFFFAKNNEVWLILTQSQIWVNEL